MSYESSLRGERFTMIDGVLVSEKARLVWADGTNVDHDDYAL